MSEKGKNHANQLARECIVTALVQLLKEKPLSAISISELTEKAGVSRMTYYRNYQAKEDIFSSYMDDILEGYREEAKRLFIDKEYCRRENLVHCFTYFEKNKEFLECLFENGLGHLLLNAVSSYILETWQKPEGGIGQYYALQAFSGALLSIYIAWSERGYKETPEEMARVLYAYIGRMQGK